MANTDSCLDVHMVESIRLPTPLPPPVDEPRGVDVGTDELLVPTHNDARKGLDLRKKGEEVAGYDGEEKEGGASRQGGCSARATVAQQRHCAAAVVVAASGEQRGRNGLLFFQVAGTQKSKQKEDYQYTTMKLVLVSRNFFKMME